MSEQILGPQNDISRVPDWRFRELIEYPYGSYDQTLLVGGWADGIGEYATGVEIDYMTGAAASAYRYFGGDGRQLPMPVAYEEVLEFVKENSSNPGFEDQIARLAYRYLSGEGEDYEGFLRQN